MTKKITGGTVRWGVIGAGDVCEVKSAPAMYKIDHSEIAAVMRRNGDKAADFAKRHNIKKWYDDADKLINDPDVNAVYIATPPSSHQELAEKVAKAGKPVYVEKPMARTYAECQSMVDTFKKYDLPLYIAYYRRTLPNFLKVKELVDSGAIGEVRMVNIEMIKPVKPNVITHLENNWRVDPEVAGGGYFYDLASHQLDYLDYLLGPVEEAKGYSLNQTNNYAADDMTVATFEFPNKVVGTGVWCYTAGQTISKEITTIIGSKGHITYGTFENSIVSWETESGEKNSINFEMPQHIQQPLIQQVVNDLLGKGECVSTGESAARTNRVLESITAQES
ncbi:MAG: Gfo/Idh/MocA family protein [Bacteroidota bacterium]